MPHSDDIQRSHLYKKVVKTKVNDIDFEDDQHSKSANKKEAG